MYKAEEGYVAPELVEHGSFVTRTLGVGGASEESTGQVAAKPSGANDESVNDSDTPQETASD
jgi:hypothetical protein